MLLYPLLTGWAAQELEPKIKGLRLQSARTSETKKTVWLTFSEKKSKTGMKPENEKIHLFFSFQTGRQLFYFAPVLETKSYPGWGLFAPSAGGAFLKSARQKGSDSAVELTFTEPDKPKENDFSLRFTLFGKECGAELFQPPTSSHPSERWPAILSEAPPIEVKEFDFSLAEIEKSLAQNSEKPMEESLRKALRIPAFLSRELLNRAEVEPGVKLSEISERQKQTLRTAIRLLLEKTGFHPALVFENRQLKGVSPFELRAVAEENQMDFPSFLEAFSYIATWEELKKFEKKLLAEKQDLLQRKEKITQELKSFENPERLRQMGDLILSAKGKIRPRSAEAVSENWFENPPVEIIIPLDPAKTPQENAEAYFTKFKKSARALELLPKRVKETEKERQKVEELLKSIEAFSLVDEKWKLVYELEALYPPPAVAKKVKAKTKPQIGWTFWTKDGFQFKVGRNSVENDQLTMREAKKNDLFLHASQSPGSHVILIAEKRPFSKDAILEAASAAAHFSKARHSTKVNVDYTEACYVQKPRKAKAGLVVLMRSKSVMVYPKKPERQQNPEEL